MIQDLSVFRPSRLWKQMPQDRRVAAARLFWADEESTEQQVEAIAAIAGHMKFRTKSVVGLDIDRRSKYLATLPGISDSVAARALVNYHLATQRPMMGVFLDSLGIAHEDGLISEENAIKPDARALKTAAADLAAKFPPEDVAMYFSTLVSQDPETWGTLAELPESRVGQSHAAG